MKGAKVETREKPRRRLSVIVLLIVIIVALLLLLVNFITDWMWFIEMKYVSVFFKELFTQLKIGVPVFVVLAVLLDYYLRRLRKGYFAHIDSHEHTDMKRLGRYTNLVAILFAAFMAFYAANKMWFKVLEFANSTKFGKKDPLFGMEISFYIFKLDFLKEMNEFLIAAILLIIVMTILYYAILITMHSPDILKEDDTADFTQDEDRYSGNSNPFGGDTPFGRVFDNINNSRPRRPKRRFDDNNFKQFLTIASGQLIILGVIFFLMVALHFFLKQYDLLYAHTGAVYGAGFTDVNITLWIYRILIILSVIGALSGWSFVHKKQIKKIFTRDTGDHDTGQLRGIRHRRRSAELRRFTGRDQQGKQIPRQKHRVHPACLRTGRRGNEKVLRGGQPDERRYQEQRSYDIEHQDQRLYADEKVLQPDAEYQAVLRFQRSRRRQIHGQRRLYADVPLAREIDESKISDTWLNRHLKYTHGYGVVLSKVNKITASGQPDVLIKNIPPESSVNEIKIDRPEIYFGEKTNEYIIVNTSEDEFDYPDGDSNKYTKYEGAAGIKLNPLNRVLFALREHSLKILVSTNIKSNSRIVIYRNIVERVQKIMPYLSYDEDPYAVTADGKVYWIMDAYTTSSYYPYSEPYSGGWGRRTTSATP